MALLIRLSQGCPLEEDEDAAAEDDEDEDGEAALGGRERRGEEGRRWGGWRPGTREGAGRVAAGEEGGNGVAAVGRMCGRGGCAGGEWDGLGGERNKVERGEIRWREDRVYLSFVFSFGAIFFVLHYIFRLPGGWILFFVWR